MTTPINPRRRWRVHFQLPGQPKRTRSFEYFSKAVSALNGVQLSGGRAMIEDRWPKEANV